MNTTTKPKPKPKFTASFIKPLPPFVQAIIRRSEQADTAQQCAEYLSVELRAAGYRATFTGENFVSIFRVGSDKQWATLRKEQPQPEATAQAEQVSP